MKPTAEQLKAARLEQLDLTNPYLSPLRQWIVSRLSADFPSSTIRIASNKKETQVQFELWTGTTQQKLVDAWIAQGFSLSPDPKKGVYVRSGLGPVTTSCEGLINTVLQKVRQAGLGRPARSGDKLSSFNLPGCNNGRGPATTVGWHWAKEMTDTVRPEQGDLFQLGTPQGDGWFYNHVGVILDFGAGDNPDWVTLEAGQGGPAQGCDFVARKGPRPLKPVDPMKPAKQLMGWVNIDEYLGPDGTQPAGIIPV